MIDLFIIDSPLQLMNCVEYRLTHKLNKAILIISLGGGKRANNNRQLLNLKVKYENLFDSVRVFGRDSSERVNKIVKFFQLWCLLFRIRGRSVRIIYGDFRSKFMEVARLSQPLEDWVLLDDGAATLSMKKLYWDRGIFYFNDLGSTKIGWLAFIFLPKLKCQKAGRREVFSGFNGLVGYSNELIRYKKNHMEHLRATSNIQVERSMAFHIGSKYSEVGILSVTEELQYLKSVYAFLKSNNAIHIYYIAHRDESLEKLNRVQELGYKVKFFDVPIELAIQEGANFPFIVTGFYSSALFNISFLFPIIKVSFVIPHRFSLDEANPSIKTILTWANRYYPLTNVFSILK